MKRLFAAILCLCLLAGCGRTDSTGNTCRAEEGSGESMVSGIRWEAPAKKRCLRGRHSGSSGEQPEHAAG